VSTPKWDESSDWFVKAEVLLKMINKLSVLNWTTVRRGDSLVLYCADESVSGETPVEKACWLLGGLLLGYTRQDQESLAISDIESETVSYAKTGKKKTFN
jgi:hypothetical protein